MRPWHLHVKSGIPPLPDGLIISVSVTAAHTHIINFVNSGTFNGAIDWGDGTPVSAITSWLDVDRSHTYTVAGTYDIAITGTIPNIAYNRSPSAPDVIALKGSASIPMTSFSTAFDGCSNLTSVAADYTLSGVTNLYRAFEQCNFFTFPLIDTSGVTNFEQAWKKNASLLTLPALNFDAGTTFRHLCNGCTSLATFPPNMFDAAVATDFSRAFNSCVLDMASVDNVLISIDIAGQFGGTLDIAAPNATPSAAGAAAKTNLTARGWVVNTA